MDERRMERRSWGIAGEEWRIKPNYKIKPKMFWRLNKIASDKRKLLESGKKKKKIW